MLQGTSQVADFIFYANVVSTYNSLKANYVVNGATYENVEGGSSINLFNVLFGSNSLSGTSYTNSCRMELTGVATGTTVNFGAMGFNIATNPNCINYVAGSNCTIDTNGVITFVDNNGNTIKFNLQKNSEVSSVSSELSNNYKRAI